MERDGRPPLAQLLLNFAESLAQRATCERLKVGCIITDMTMRQVFAYGYNGNARGLQNRCDDPTVAGACGCLHAEMNALVKAPGQLVGGILFTSVAPCVMCAKASVNAGIRRVIFRQPYRTFTGLNVLVTSGVRCDQLDLHGTFVEWDAPMLRSAVEAASGL